MGCSSSVCGRGRTQAPQGDGRTRRRNSRPTTPPTVHVSVAPRPLSTSGTKSSGHRGGCSSLSVGTGGTGGERRWIADTLWESKSPRSPIMRTTTSGRGVRKWVKEANLKSAVKFLPRGSSSAPASTDDDSSSDDGGSGVSHSLAFEPTPGLELSPTGSGSPRSGPIPPGASTPQHTFGGGDDHDARRGAGAGVGAGAGAGVGAGADGDVLRQVGSFSRASVSGVQVSLHSYDTPSESKDPFVTTRARLFDADVGPVDGQVDLVGRYERSKSITEADLREPSAKPWRRSYSLSLDDADDWELQQYVQGVLPHTPFHWFATPSTQSHQSKPASSSSPSEHSRMRRAHPAGGIGRWSKRRRARAR